MAEFTAIPWCDHTYNPWEGCQHDGPGCLNCYAETRNKRFAKGANWGPHAHRRRTGLAGRRAVLRWNAAARATNRPDTVFAASIADIFDLHPSIDPRWRADFWSLVAGTPWLIWLVATKRIRHAAELLPPDWGAGYPNVMLISTVCRQAEADRDIPTLLATPAAARGLSMEPLLEGVRVRRWLHNSYECAAECGYRSASAPAEEKCGWCGWRGVVVGEFCPECCRQDFTELCPECGSYALLDHPDMRVLDWVIIGGESGRGARVSNADHHRRIIGDCLNSKTAVFEKQLGAHFVDERNGIAGAQTKIPPENEVGKVRRLRDRSGADMSEWPEDLRVRQFPAWFGWYAELLRGAA